MKKYINQNLLAGITLKFSYLYKAWNEEAARDSKSALPRTSTSNAFYVSGLL